MQIVSKHIGEILDSHKIRPTNIEFMVCYEPCYGVKEIVKIEDGRYFYTNNHGLMVEVDVEDINFKI